MRPGISSGAGGPKEPSRHGSGRARVIGGWHEALRGASTGNIEHSGSVHACRTCSTPRLRCTSRRSPRPRRRRRPPSSTGPLRQLVESILIAAIPAATQVFKASALMVRACQVTCSRALEPRRTIWLRRERAEALLRVVSSRRNSWSSVSRGLTRSVPEVVVPSRSSASIRAWEPSRLGGDPSFSLMRLEQPLARLGSVGASGASRIAQLFELIGILLGRRHDPHPPVELHPPPHPGRSTVVDQPVSLLAWMSARSVRGSHDLRGQCRR